MLFFYDFYIVSSYLIGNGSVFAKETLMKPKEGYMGDASNHTCEQLLMPGVNFSTFILSLNSSALVNLGQIPDPAIGTKEKNLQLAKYTIDVIMLLEEKTRGNLSTDEANLIKNILHDLKLAYVRECR